MQGLIFIFGKICSGKNFYSTQIKEREGHHHIIVSDIVKDLIKTTDRKKLQDTKHLDKLIAEELIKQINLHEKVVVDGIRQLSILLKVIRDVHRTYEYIWLEVPESILVARFKNRADDKDQKIPIMEALHRDNQLGLGELEEWLKLNPNTQIVNNY